MRGRTAALMCATVLVLLGATAVTPTFGAFTHADLNNSQNSSKTARLSGTYTVGTNTCTADPSGSCQSQVISGAPASGGAKPMTGTLTNTSNRPGSYSQSMQISECEPLKFDDSANAAAVLMARGGIGRQVTDKWGSKSAAAFDGSNDSLTGIQPMPLSQMAAGSWSMGIWFRAAPGSVGTSMLGGASSVQTAADSSRGGTPALRLLDDGRIRVEWVNSVGSMNGSTVVGTPNLRDGLWHLAVASVERAAGVPSRMRVFVDGVQSQEITVSEMTPATGINFYWHIGWVDASRAQAPSNPFFTGDLSGAFYRPAATTLAQAASLYNSASAATYQTSLLGINAANLWMLADDANNRYTQSLSYVDSGGDPCHFAAYDAVYNGASLLGPRRVSDLVTQAAGGTGWYATAPAPASGSWQFTPWFNRWETGYDLDCANLEIQLTYSHRVLLTNTNWAYVFRWPRVNLIM